MAQRYVPATDGYDVDIGAVYTIDYTDYATIMSDEFANRVLAAVDFPGFDAYWTFEEIANANFDDTNFMACAILSGACTDCLVLADGYIGQGAYPDDGIASRVNMTLPHGGFKINFPVQVAHGSLVGRGSANFTSSATQVHSAGTGAVDGEYARDFSTNDRPRYTIGGGTTDDDSIFWDGSAWVINSGGVSMYESTDDVTYPHKVTTWVATGGAGPVPTVQRPSASGTTPGTCLIIDHNYWLTDCIAERFCVMSTQWGNLSFNGYMEGESIRFLRCDGACYETDTWEADPGHYDPTYSSSGIAMWSPGSVSNIMHNFCHDFNDGGILLGDKSTPATLFNNSLFRNQIAGVDITGGGTVIAISTECDGSPAVFHATGSPGQVSITAIGIKVEDGPAPQIPYPKGCCIADLEAWTHLTVVGASMASTLSAPDILVRVESTANESYVEVSGLKIFGYYRTLMHDVNNQKKWLVDMGEDEEKWNSGIHGFTWISNSNGHLKTDFIVPRQIDGVASGRLQWLSVGETPSVEFDDAAGTPPYIY